MNFDLDDHQQALVATVDRVVRDRGPEQAFEVSAQNGFDAQLDAALHAAVPLDGPDLLGRVLVADRLAELGTATTFGTALALAAAADEYRAAGPVSVVGPTGLARFGAQAAVGIVTDTDLVRAVSLSGVCVEPVRSGFGYPYARIDPDALAAADDLVVLDARRWQDACTLIRAAEVAGAAAAAIGRTAEHLRGRVQFGRPLSTLQALRHRFAEAAVSAEATRWLVREAAYTGAPRSIAVAAQYAHRTAATLVPELVQLGGARSFAREFGLHVGTMRLEALRLELGRPDLLASDVNAAPLPAGVANGR